MTRRNVIQNRKKKRKHGDGAGGASTPAGAEVVQNWRSTENSRGQNVTVRNEQLPSDVSSACITRHYGVVQLVEERGRTKDRHTYYSPDDLEEMSGTEWVLAVSGGLDMVRFVLEHGTCRFRDLAKFVSSRLPYFLGYAEGGFGGAHRHHQLVVPIELQTVLQSMRSVRGN